MKFHFYSINVVVVLFHLLSGCQTSTHTTPLAEKSQNSTAATTEGNSLTMKVNGTIWKADHDIMGFVDPKMYPNAILIAGNKGPKDKFEQTFNLNIYNAVGKKTIDFKDGNGDHSEVQLANLSETNYLYGNVLGFTFHVNILKAVKSPVQLEVEFHGDLIGNAGDTVHITEGKLYYHE